MQEQNTLKQEKTGMHPGQEACTFLPLSPFCSGEHYALVRLGSYKL